MTDAHPTFDEVLGAFGDAFCLLYRYTRDNGCDAGDVVSQAEFEVETILQVKGIMEELE